MPSVQHPLLQVRARGKPKANCWGRVLARAGRTPDTSAASGEKEPERGQACTEDAFWQLTQRRGKQVEISDLSWRKLLKESQAQACAQNKTRPLLCCIENLKDIFSITVIFLVNQGFLVGCVAPQATGNPLELLK